MLKERLRKTDSIGRYGGDEIAVAQPNISASNAVLVLDKFRHTFSQTKQISAGGNLKVTISCGVAIFPDHNDVTSTTGAANKDLFVAKTKCRNKVILNNIFMGMSRQSKNN